MLVHDNDPKHRSKIVADWIHSKQIEKWPSPPHSPDLNPLEQVCLFIQRELQKTASRNLQELRNKIIEIWDLIREETTAPHVGEVSGRFK